MIELDGKCGIVSDFSLCDGTRFRCKLQFDHLNQPHSWEKYRLQFIISGGILSEEVDVCKGMICPCQGDHFKEANWQSIYDLIKMLGPLVKVSISKNGECWMVPRVYIACHNLMLEELPSLAEKFGWLNVKE